MAEPEQKVRTCRRCKQRLGPGGVDSRCRSRTCPYCAVCMCDGPEPGPPEPKNA